MPGSPSFGFSTIGAPDASFETAGELMRKYGLQFLELRSLEGSLDLPRYFQARDISRETAGVQLLGTSLHLTKASSADMEAFYRFAELAERLGAPYLRVFGASGSDMGATLTDADLDAAAATVQELRDTLETRGWTCEILLETHDVFSSSGRCLALNSRLPKPLRILWDSHHTWRLAGESPQETWDAIGDLVAHIHYKDSVFGGDCSEVHYVLPGKGDYPGGALKDLLSARQYSHGISLEWEKLWHPELPGIEEALQAFGRYLRLF